MDEIKELTKKIVDFRDNRDWEQFHNAKDLSIALSIEASELLENFLWRQAKDAEHESIKEELADVFMYAFLLAHKEDLDVQEIVEQKLKMNNEKYPVSKSKGNATKYTDL